jgi:Homeodomain-like domain
VVGKEIVVKKYVVRLSAEEHAQLDELIRKGKRSAQLLTKARILLKADVSELGEGWSDSRIAAALDTSIATIERTRRQLVEEGFEAVLRRKYNWWRLCKIAHIKKNGLVEGVSSVRMTRSAKT